MSYRSAGHGTRINYWSSSKAKFGPDSRPLGNPENDVARLLTENRFKLAAIGDEAVSCQEDPLTGEWRADSPGFAFWSDWACWSVCSKKCGGGSQTRKRRCQGRTPPTFQSGFQTRPGGPYGSAFGGTPVGGSSLDALPLPPPPPPPPPGSPFDAPPPPPPGPPFDQPGSIGKQALCSGADTKVRICNKHICSGL